jgi:anti-sigma-K factor RskA
MRQIEGPRQQPIAPVRTSAWSQGARLGAAFASGACAMAAFVAAVLLWPSQAPPGISARLVQAPPGIPAKLIAELEKSSTANGMMPARVTLGFVVYFDLRASTMVVSPLAVPPGSRRDYQLWLVPDGSAPPISLGVIPLAEPTTLPWPATFPPNDLTRATLAVSLEPAGGAPTGVPTSPTMSRRTTSEQTRVMPLATACLRPALGSPRCCWGMTTKRYARLRERGITHCGRQPERLRG